jgi:hypothetical protein
MWNISYTYFSAALLVGFYVYTSLALKGIYYHHESCIRTSNVLYVIILATAAYLKTLYLYCHLPARTRKSITKVMILLGI